MSKIITPRADCLASAMVEMGKPHPMPPHGVPDRFIWATRPQVVMGLNPTESGQPAWWIGPKFEEWRAVTAWWVAYEAKDGNPKPDVDLWIGLLDLWVKTRAGKWICLQYGNSVWAKPLKEPETTTEVAIKVERGADGVICRPGKGMAVHGGHIKVQIPWIDGVGPDVVEMFASVQHKVIGSDALYAHYCVQCAVDYWPDVPSSMTDVAPATYVPGAVLGPFVRSWPGGSHSHVWCGR